MERTGMRPRAGHAIVFSYGFVECGRNIQEPGGSELRRAGPFTLANAAGEVGQVLKERVKIFA